LTPVQENLPLRDIHLPDPVGWWPPAPGWWGLIAICLLALFAILGFILLRRRSRLKRRSLVMLQQLAEQFRQDGDERQLTVQLSVLLRRIALSIYPRRRVAALTGPEWLEFLDRSLTADGKARAFREGIGRVLIEAPYTPACQVDGNALIDLIRQWINRNAGTRRG